MSPNIQLLNILYDDDIELLLREQPMYFYGWIGGWIMFLTLKKNTGIVIEQMKRCKQK